jgi:predicted MFS family arabinose efflux permease
MHRNIKLLLTCSILIHGGVNLLAPIYALYIKEIGGTLLLASATIGFYAILKGILYFLFKKLDETRFSSKTMIAGGYFLFAVSYLLYIGASKPMHVFGIQALLAFAEVVINPSWSSTIATSLTKGKERGIYSDFYGYRSIFEGFAAIVGGFLAMRLGFNALFGLMAGFALMASVLGLFLVKEKK